MPAKSKSQQRLFGMVHAYQKGELKNPSSEIKSIAKSISKKDAEDFAETKHKGLPNKVKSKKNEERNMGKNKVNESYGIGYKGQFIKKGGWGPTFTSFPEDAIKFRTPEQAQQYMEKNLGDDFGASVVSLPLQENKNVVRINENQLHSLIAESIKRVLKEQWDFDDEDDTFTPQGYKTDSNWGGTEIQINKNGDAARLRDNHGTPGTPTDWMEIQFDENGVAYVETENGTVRLDEFMRV